LGRVGEVRENQGKRKKKDGKKSALSRNRENHKGGGWEKRVLGRKGSSCVNRPEHPDRAEVPEGKREREGGTGGGHTGATRQHKNTAGCCSKIEIRKELSPSEWPLAGGGVKKKERVAKALTAGTPKKPQREGWARVSVLGEKKTRKNAL